MAKLPYSWSKVSAGDIVSFVYKNRDGRNLRRTILVIDPKLLNRAKNKSSQYLVHGIQLEVSNVPTNMEMKKILETAGTPEVVDEDKKIYRVILDGNSKQIYRRLKSLIKKHETPKSGLWLQATSKRSEVLKIYVNSMTNKKIKLSYLSKYDKKNTSNGEKNGVNKSKLKESFFRATCISFESFFAFFNILSQKLSVIGASLKVCAQI